MVSAQLCSSSVCWGYTRPRHKSTDHLSTSKTHRTKVLQQAASTKQLTRWKTQALPRRNILSHHSEPSTSFPAHKKSSKCQRPSQVPRPQQKWLNYYSTAWAWPQAAAAPTEAYQGSVSPAAKLVGVSHAWDTWHSSKQVCAEVWGEYLPIRREFQPWEMYCCKKKVLKHNRLCELLFPDFRSCVPWLHIHPCSIHTWNKAVLT